MWYWYGLRVVGFLIGLVSYSSLVVAGRADDRRDAIEREEYLKSRAWGSAQGMEPCFNDNSEGRVSPLTSTVPPQIPLTNIKHPTS
jgi:hypothetical protein